MRAALRIAQPLDNLISGNRVRLSELTNVFRKFYHQPDPTLRESLRQSAPVARWRMVISLCRSLYRQWLEWMCCFERGCRAQQQGFRIVRTDQLAPDR